MLPPLRINNVKTAFLSACLVSLYFAEFAATLEAQSPSATAEPATRAPASTKPNDRPVDRGQPRRRGGVPKSFPIDPGWAAGRFPDHAMCFQTPDVIAATYVKATNGKSPAVTSFNKPTDGSLRIVATGHSFMAPGYKTLPAIAKAAGFDHQGMLTHVGGGITGSARYKWEQENGIFQFNGKPVPKLLSSIAAAEWDVMLWGPYYNDRPEFYSCWIDFCLKTNPDMKFYLSDAWPQLDQLPRIPRDEAALTNEVIAGMHDEKRETYGSIIDELKLRYGNRVFVLPTSRAMVLAVESFHRGDLAGVTGIHKAVGGKARSLWRDRLGHLGNGIETLEGYVFYATLYGRSPELIDTELPVRNPNNFPSKKLDHEFRRIAWQAVTTDPLTGITDEDGNGMAD